MENIEKLTFSVPEAARALGICQKTVYTLTRRADFPAFRCNNRVVISVEGLRAWVLKQATGEGGGGMTQQQNYILSDEELRSLSEFTMYSEGDAFMWVIDMGVKVGGFWGLAEQVAKATAADAVHLRSGQARALLAMRAFYFLGVLRGGEAYRNLVIFDDDTEPEFKELPFEVDSELFVDDLNELQKEDFNSMLALLGLSVPWAAEDKKGDAEA